jgi:hypothetical protein
MLVRVEPGVVTTALGHGVLVILSEATGKLHQLNPTAAVIWHMLASHGGDTEATAVTVAEHYGVAPDLVRHDLDALVDQLSQDGLVRVES